MTRGGHPSHRCPCRHRIALSTVPEVTTFETVKEGEMSKPAVRKRVSETAPTTENETVG
jgi:hypothetical protein